MHVKLIEANGAIFRSYFASPPMERLDGTPVNAVYGFCETLLYNLARQDATHVAVVFDAPGPTLRHDIHPDYKANRPPKPYELTVQLPLVRQLVEAFGLAKVEIEGFEADDVIATYADRVTASHGTTTIVSSDKDLMQLLQPSVIIFDPGKGQVLTDQDCINKFGVTPGRLVDVQALAGDTVDNVPGLPGIGLKIAAQLVNEFGSLEGVLENWMEVSGPKRQEAIRNGRELALKCRDLVRLSKTVPVPPLAELALRPIDKERVLAFLADPCFRPLHDKIADLPV